MRSGFATSANVSPTKFGVGDFGALRTLLAVWVRDFLGPGNLLAVRVRDLSPAKKSRFGTTEELFVPEVLRALKKFSGSFLSAQFAPKKVFVCSESLRKFLECSKLCFANLFVIFIS